MLAVGWEGLGTLAVQLTVGQLDASRSSDCFVLCVPLCLRRSSFLGFPSMFYEGTMWAFARRHLRRLTFLAARLKLDPYGSSTAWNQKKYLSMSFCPPSPLPACVMVDQTIPNPNPNPNPHANSNRSEKQTVNPRAQGGSASYADTLPRNVSPRGTGVRCRYAAP